MNIRTHQTQIAHSCSFALFFHLYSTSSGIQLLREHSRALETPDAQTTPCIPGTAIVAILSSLLLHNGPFYFIIIPHFRESPSAIPITSRYSKVEKDAGVRSPYRPRRLLSGMRRKACYLSPKDAIEILSSQMIILRYPLIICISIIVVST